MQSLDELGITFGTDKSRLRQDYLRRYERPLMPFRDRKITLLEIGIHNGASLQMWKAYLPSAQIVGIDIEASTKRFEGNGILVEIGSQADPVFLEDVARRYSPDVIIDDGSHLPEHQIFSFETLSPMLPNGGLYIVEDVSDDPALSYFSDLGRKVFTRTASRAVGGVQFIGSAVLIDKTGHDPLDEDYDTLERMARSSNLQGECLFYLSEYMHRMGAPVDRSLAVGVEASQLMPYNCWAHFHVSKLKLQAGDKDGALAAATEADRVSQMVSHHTHPLILDHLRRLQA